MFLRSIKKYIIYNLNKSNIHKINCKGKYNYYNNCIIIVAIDDFQILLLQVDDILLY